VSKPKMRNLRMAFGTALEFSLEAISLYYGDSLVLR